MSGRLVITAQPFSPETENAAFRTHLLNSGGVVSFMGVVRSESDDGLVLTLQHYPGYTEHVISDYVARIRRAWTLEDWLIIHRVGAMFPGEPIVLVAAAARHRRDAFAAADCMMDMLKTRAPFWKKEERDGRTTWIEPRAEDHNDIERWRDVLGE